jgi:hypothetical protein
MVWAAGAVVTEDPTEGGTDTAEPIEERPRRRPLGAYIGTAIAAVVAVVFALRLLGQPWPHFPASFPDSLSYLKVAKTGPFHVHFYFDERPIGFPLLLWAVRRSTTWAVVAQTAIYVAAFWILCRVVLSDLRSRVVGIVVVIFIAAIAIEPRNSMWNTLILSESLSTSCAVLSIAAWWRALTRPSARQITIAWVATLAWILVRDASVLPTVVVIIPAALLIAILGKHIERAMRIRLAAGAMVVLLACGYVYVSQAVSRRNQYPIHNNIGERILPDAAATRWFVQGGMPLDDALRQQKYRSSWDANNAFLVAPDLARYRHWANSSGSRRLFLSMVELAPFWWRHLHADLPMLLNDPKYLGQAYDSYRVFHRLPTHLPAPLGEPRTTRVEWFEMLLAAAGLGVASTDRRRRLLALGLGIGLLSAVVDFYCAYVGDANEVGRHEVGALLRLDVMLLLAIALGADTALVRWRTIPRPAPPEPAAPSEAEPAPADATV